MDTRNSARGTPPLVRCSRAAGAAPAPPAEHHVADPSRAEPGILDLRQWMAGLERSCRTSAWGIRLTTVSAGSARARKCARPARTRSGRRDHAILRVLGDLGLRGGELRALAGRHLRRPRSDSPRRRLLVPGKGGAERQLAMPRACQQAVESWLLVHPLARRGEIDPDAPLFVRLGRHERLSPGPLSAGAVHDLVRRCATEAGIPRRLAHPHQLRTFCATRLLEAGIPLHQVSQMLGHATLQTTARYAALRSGWDEELAEMTERLERR